MLLRVLGCSMDTLGTQPINFPNKNLKSIHESLLLGKKWRYLRYLHAREAILLASDIKTVLVIGAGHGLAELGLALEFPNIEFYLTDHAQATHSQLVCRDRVAKWNINNVHFFELDILSPKPNIGNYDLVYSVEVLEHIENASKAVKNMIQIANKYIFCLVPFAESALNDDSFSRERALIRHGHHVVGYDSETLLALFPGSIEIRGCYWRDGGLILRNKLSSMSANEISLNLSELHEIAIKDLRLLVPSSTIEAQGIWVLSKLDESCSSLNNFYLMRKGLIIKKDFLSAYSLEQSYIKDFGLDERLVISHAWTLNALKRHEECTTFLLKAALCLPNNETIIEKLKLHLSQKPCQ